jgi:transcription initiation factor TFIIIB Brf1 subunit/transcription initiation factor TFIIB
MENTGGRFPLWSVLVIAATVGSAAAGAAWQVGRSRMEDELSQYRRSVDLGLPETLKAMRELSKGLTISLEERRQLETVPRLRKENDLLRKQLADAKQALQAARESLTALEGDTFKLTEGKTRSVVPGRLALGISDASYKSCSVRLGKESTTLFLGEHIETVEGGMSYRVILLETEDGISCKFSLSREAVQ